MNLSTMEFEMSFLTSRKRTGLGLVVLVCLLACPLVWPSEAAAQAMAFVGGGGNKKATYDQYMSQLNNKRAAAEERIAVRLSDIDLACQLDDGQKKKLEVASKGAVNSYMKGVVKQLIKNAKRGNFDFEPDNPPVEDEGEEEEDQVQIRQVNRFVFLNGAPFGVQQEPTVEQEKIWGNSLDKTLTLEQVEKLTTWRNERNRSNRTAAVNHFVARVDLSLLLTFEQREKLIVWVDESYGERLSGTLGQNPNPARRVVVIGRNIGGAPDSPRETKPAVAEILNEPQQKVWAKSFQNELDQLNRPKPNGVFGFNAAPAVLNLKINNAVEEKK